MLLVRIATMYGWLLGVSGKGPVFGVKKRSWTMERIARCRSEQLVLTMG